MVAKDDVRDRLVDIIVDLFVRETPRLTTLIQRGAETSSQTSVIRRVAYVLSEQLGLINWEQIRESLRETLASQYARREIFDFIGTLGVSLAEAVRSGPELSPHLSAFA
ncbi:MAG: hypothetical protein NZ899_04375 [Thermoguttaceae bacterium]|nr:hypothetical protein [Thermoguttaceae bacterium]MDW8077629.1 hypothetical protein [Thermoguttaceae bacterium]